MSRTTEEMLNTSGKADADRGSDQEAKKNEDVEAAKTSSNLPVQSSKLSDKEVTILNYTSDESTQFTPEDEIQPLPTGLTSSEQPSSLPGAYAESGRPVFASQIVQSTGEATNGDVEAPPVSPLDHNLVTASLVVEDAPTALPRAEEWPVNTEEEQGQEDSSNKKWRKQALRGGITMAVLVLLAVVLVVVLTGGERHEEESLSGPLTGQAPEEYLSSLLPLSTVDAAKDLGSPQGLAFDWVLRDPHFDKLPSWRLVQRFALATFYYATTDEEGWERNDGWLSYWVHECDWFHSGFAAVTDGVYNSSDYSEGICGGTTMEEYHFLLIMTNKLHGRLPPELSLLTSLRGLSLRGHQLQGTIPSQIGELQSLFVVDLSANLLTGTIPSEIGSLPLLDGIFLFYNKLTGQIPLEVTKLSSLVHLIIDANELTGMYITVLIDLFATVSNPKICSILGTFQAHFIQSLELCQV